MKLVRARPKDFEYLPGWSKCYKEAIANDRAVGEVTVDLDDSAMRSGMFCDFCNAEAPTYKSVRMVDGVGKGFRIGLDILDLDEGEFATP